MLLVLLYKNAALVVLAIVANVVCGILNLNETLHSKPLLFSYLPLNRIFLPCRKKCTGNKCKRIWLRNVTYNFFVWQQFCFSISEVRIIPVRCSQSRISWQILFVHKYFSSLFTAKNQRCLKIRQTSWAAPIQRNTRNLRKCKLKVLCSFLLHFWM